MNHNIKKIALAGALTTISTGTIATNLAPTAYAAPMAPSTNTATYKVNADQLNIRSGAGAQYKIVSTINKNTILTGTLTNGWLKITSGPYANNYASASYLTKYTPLTQSVPVVSTSNEKTYKVNTTTLNVRNGAGTNYSILSTIAKGTQLSGTITNGWLKINSGVYAGKYVSASYVTEVANATVSNINDSQTALRAKIINLAASQAGTPYVWGGNTASVGLDCSGLTSWVYKQVGIQLPRVSNNQANFAKPVSADQAKPGDLVFLFDSHGVTYHVGILLDPVAKTYWEAPHPGDVVKIGTFGYTNNYKFGTVL